MNENLENLKQKAVQLFHDKHWDELIPVCTEIIDLEQETHEKAHAYVQRGVAYLHKRHFDQAIVDFTKALELKVDYAEAYCERGVAYGVKGDLDQAIADFTKALELKVDYAEAYHNRGVVYDLKDDLDQAIVNFNEALRIDPDDAEPHRGCGIAWSKKGDHDRAIACFSKAVELRPTDAMMYVDRGIAYDERGDHDQAIADFSKATNLDPTNGLAWHNRGQAHSHRGRTYTQRNMTSKAIADFDKAIHDFDEAIRLNPKEASTYSGRGGAYIEKESYDLALNDFVRADECDPNLKMRAPAIYITSQIADIYKEAGQEDDKVTAFKFYFRLFRASDAVKRNRFWEPKAEVAHYTSLHTLKTLAARKRFRFYNAAYMNDPEEGRVFFEIMKKSGIDVQQVFYGDEDQSYPSPAYIGSFVKVDDPKQKDELFLWRTYGKHDGQEATGACLIFKHEGTVFAENCGPQIGAMQQLQLKLLMSADDRKNPGERQPPKPDLYEIVYRDKENNQELFEELSELATSLKQIKEHIEEEKDDENNEKLRKLVRDLLDGIRFLFKARHYQEEGEVRVVHVRYYDETKTTQKEEGIHVDAEQIPLRFYLETHDDFRFSEVILGPQARGEAEWKRWLKEQDKTLNVKRSGIKYGKPYL